MQSRHLQASSGARRSNVFLAVLPEPPAATRIADLAGRLVAEHRLRGRPIDARRLHVSLHAIGLLDDLPGELVSTVGEIASTIAMPRFRVEFDAFVSFRGRARHRPLALCGEDGVVGLLMLQRELAAAMGKARLGIAAPTYLPHVTVFYGEPAPVRRFVEPVGWTVRELVLVRSLLGQSRHLPVARIPLAG